MRTPLHGVLPVSTMAEAPASAAFAGFSANVHALRRTTATSPGSIALA